MSRRLITTALAALGLWLAGGSTPARASGCAKVKLGTATVSEAAGTVSFTISADELPAPDPPPDPPPPDSPPPNLGDGGIVDPPPPARRARAFCTVSYATSDGTATAGADYSAVNGSAALDPGEKTTISVPILDDGDDEPDESFTVGLAGEPPETVTITDNDLPAPPSPPKPPAGPGTPTQATTTPPGGDGGIPGVRPLAPLPPADDKTPPVIVISPPVEHASGPVWIVTCPATEASCAGTVRLTTLPAGGRAHAA